MVVSLYTTAMLNYQSEGIKSQYVSDKSVCCNNRFKLTCTSQYVFIVSILTVKLHTHWYGRCTMKFKYIINGLKTCYLTNIN